MGVRKGGGLRWVLKGITLACMRGKLESESSLGDRIIPFPIASCKLVCHSAELQ